MSFSISQDNSQLISFLKQINYSNYNSEYSDDFINLSNIWYGSNKITNQIAQLPTIPPQLFQPYIIDRGRRQAITTPTLNVGDSITLQKTVSFGSRFTFRINGTVIPISPPLIEFILTTPCRAYIYGGLQLLKLFLNKIKHFLKKTKN